MFWANPRGLPGGGMYPVGIDWDITTTIMTADFKVHDDKDLKVFWATIPQVVVFVKKYMGW